MKNFIKWIKYPLNLPPEIANTIFVSYWGVYNKSCYIQLFFSTDIFLQNFSKCYLFFIAEEDRDFPYDPLRISHMPIFQV